MNFIGTNYSGKRHCMKCNKQLDKELICMEVIKSVYYGKENYGLICTECLLSIIIKTDAKKYLTKKGIAIALAGKI